MKGWGGQVLAFCTRLGTPPAALPQNTHHTVAPAHKLPLYICPQPLLLTPLQVVLQHLHLAMLPRGRHAQKHRFCIR